MSFEELTYSSLDNAYIVAQKVGKTEELCNEGSNFKTLQAACKACLDKRGYNYSDAGTEPVLQYCDGGIPLTGVVTVTMTITTNGMMVPLTLATSFSIAPAGLRTAETSSASTASQPTSTGAPTAVSPGLDTPAPTESPKADDEPSRAWMAGPVAGSVAGVVLVALVFWFASCRRQRARLAARNGDAPLEKPQLHSDCVPKPMPPEVEANERYELSGEPFSTLSPHELGPGGPEKQGLMLGSRSELGDPELSPPEIDSGGNTRRTHPE